MLILLQAIVQPAGAAVTITSNSDPPALKILVEEDGIYQITYTDLESAGWYPATLDPTNLQLSHLDTELPIWVQDQENGVFDPSDLIIFYGQAMTGRYTRQNVYWLTVGGTPGLRMDERDAAPVHGYPVPASFPITLHAEEHPTWYGYWQNPPGREAQDHWYWTGRLEAPASTDLTFQMPSFDAASADFGLRVLLAGRTDDSAIPDHHTRLILNGTLVDEAWWDGKIEFQHNTTFSPTSLNVGSNTLSVETVGDTGAVVDSLYANWLEVDYQALYTSQDDELAFGVPAAGDYQFQVGGFSSEDTEVFDITDPISPVRLLKVESQPEGNGYTAVFEDHAEAAARYLALTPAQRCSPSALVPDQPSDLRNPANGADEIIIAYEDFYTATLPLAAHREFQGLRVQVIRISDVYDEFSGGFFTPQAIRDFLAYAYVQWTPPAPSYVLLVGDAHLDYLNRFGTGTPNYVPTYIFDATDVGETANDNWFACVGGNDPLPDLFLGRLPARS
ncbi:MAG: hypothetical protein KJ638_05520, partial [Chloroflexi bacterium]|nr:hypothetical protein [Chloroflexota bacterium]